MARRGEVLALYKSMLRAAQKVPVDNKRDMALARIKRDFRKCITQRLAQASYLILVFLDRSSRSEEDEGNIDDLIIIGNTHLETLTIQAYDSLSSSIVNFWNFPSLTSSCKNYFYAGSAPYFANE
jgi:hypothetical protein